MLVPAEGRRDIYATLTLALLCFTKYSIACPIKQISVGGMANRALSHYRGRLSSHL